MDVAIDSVQSWKRGESFHDPDSFEEEGGFVSGDSDSKRSTQSAGFKSISSSGKSNRFVSRLGFDLDLDDAIRPSQAESILETRAIGRRRLRRSIVIVRA